MKCKAYFYNQDIGSFFVHDVTYKPNTNFNVFRVGVTRYPSVNGLMNRVFKKYRKGKLDKFVVQDAMKVLEYDPDYELFVKEDKEKHYSV